MSSTDPNHSEASTGAVYHQRLEGHERVNLLLDEGASRFEQIVADEGHELPPHGCWEAALVLTGEIPPHRANRAFLQLMDRANRRYTGWPIWRVMSDIPGGEPRVFREVWESFNAGLNNIDFIRFDPEGSFFHRRAYVEDVGSDDVRSSRPQTALNVSIPVMRVAEAIAVGSGLATAMGCNPAKTTLRFGFRWTKLQGRELTCYKRHELQVPPGNKAYQDEITSFVDVPLSTPLTGGGLFPFVNRVVQPLFEVFNGFEADTHDVGELTRYIVEEER